MEELREKALFLLDFDFKMIELEQDSCIRKLRINNIKGAIEFACSLDLLTINEWEFLYKCLVVYKSEIFLQETEQSKTTLELIDEVVEKYNLDYYKVLEDVDKALDNEFGFGNRKCLSEEWLSKQLYETILLGFEEEYEQ